MTLRNVCRGFPDSPVSKESACSTGDLGSIPGSGRFPREGNGNPLQYSCLENPMSKGTWQATVHGVARVRHNLATKPSKELFKSSKSRLEQKYLWFQTVKFKSL